MSAFFGVPANLQILYPKIEAQIKNWRLIDVWVLCIFNFAEASPFTVQHRKTTLGIVDTGKHLGDYQSVGLVYFNFADL